MPITSVTSEPERCTLTVVGDYAVPVRRLWEAWADPRQIERFWGPPSWPATFTRHDMVAGGRSEYFMTGPNGERSAGYWTFDDVVEGGRISVTDGFADGDGAADDEMPSMTMVMTFEATPNGSRFTSITTFPSVEAMEQLIAMGMMEGLSAAMGQMDDVLADLTMFAADEGTTTKRLTDTKVRVSRRFRGSVDQVWRAFREPDLIRRWMLGPDGWTMPVCEEADAPGDTYRHEWESEDGEQRFGFEGTLHRALGPAPHGVRTATDRDPRRVGDRRRVDVPTGRRRHPARGRDDRTDGRAARRDPRDRHGRRDGGVVRTPRGRRAAVSLTGGVPRCRAS